MSESRARIAAAIDHELRQPLAVVVGYAELLRVREDADFRVEAAARIIEASERLSTRLERLNEALAGLPVEVLDRIPARLALPSLSPSTRETPPAAEQKILLVDDDEALRSLLRATLPTAEFVVLEAGDAERAIQVVELEDPAIVVLDWNLPGRSGAELLAELTKRYGDMPVVVLTADARQREAAAALGAQGFLTKPFSPLELLGAVDKLVRERTANQRP